MVYKDFASIFKGKPVGTEYGIGCLMEDAICDNYCRVWLFKSHADAYIK